MRERDIPHIPIDECVKGHLYWIDSRNLSYGVFDGSKHNSFIGIRMKFNDRYLDSENHWDNGPPHGTARPYLDLGPIPDGIIVAEYFPGIWVKVDGKLKQVNRRDLRESEEPHGTRKGFVDEWTDTGERIPDKTWPYCINNEQLFMFLDSYWSLVSDEDKKKIEETERMVFPWLEKQEENGVGVE